MGEPVEVAVEGDDAAARDDLHALGSGRAEVIRARIDDAERLFLAGGKKDSVADDAAVEVDVGLGHGGNAGKLG